MNRIFFADLDGTLLNSQKEISPATRAALVDFINAGNYFAICTGRPIPSAKKVFNKLNVGVHNCFIIAFNGAQIYDCENERTIYRCEIPNEMLVGVFDLADKHGIHVQTYTDTHVLFRRNCEASEYYVNRMNLPPLVNEDILSVLPDPASKLLVVELHSSDKAMNFLKDVENTYGDVLATVRSDELYYDIYPRRAGKGVSVERLCEHLNVPIQDSFAAGDQQNDLSMLQTAGTSIAMINGSDEVKAVSDIITTLDNDHDGLEEYLRKFTN